MTVNIIGIDCATQDPKVGMCLAEADARRLRILQVATGKGIVSPIHQIVEWIESEGTTLLALDAPLGWPLPLSNILSRHEAGQLIHIKPDLLFRRRTDLIVEEILGKRPLEVGADRIARTAHSALELLSKIGEIEDRQIPLVWKHNQLPPLSAIEVYPSATLRTRSVKSEGYKGKDRVNARSSILEQIQNELDITTDKSVIVSDDNMFDAVICALAAFDFMNGECLIPVDMELARKEGWIWFRSPNE
jgi:hypothetical protein